MEERTVKVSQQLQQKYFNWIERLCLDSFELEIEYACQGEDRSYVEDGMGMLCQDAALSSEEDEGSIFIVNGECPGNSPAIEEEARCGNNVFLQCHGGCLR